MYIKRVSELNERDKSLLVDIRFLSLSYEFDMVANAQGDLDAIYGVENVKEALYRRLVTPKGALFWIPDYGTRLMELLNQPATQSNLDLLEMEVRRAIQDEPRLDSDSSVRVYYDGEVVGITVQATIIGSNISSEFQFVVRVDNNMLTRK